MSTADQSNIIIFQPETITDLYGRVFYGLKYDPSTGLASFEQIEVGEIISLPVLGDGVDYTTDDYVTWMSSSKYLDFYWESTLSSNLIMEVA
jgi:hypothetical protein